MDYFFIYQSSSSIPCEYMPLKLAGVSLTTGEQFPTTDFLLGAAWLKKQRSSQKFVGENSSRTCLKDLEGASLIFSIYCIYIYIQIL